MQTTFKTTDGTDPGATLSALAPDAIRAAFPGASSSCSRPPSCWLRCRFLRSRGGRDRPEPRAGRSSSGRSGSAAAAGASFCSSCERCGSRRRPRGHGEG